MLVPGFIIDKIKPTLQEAYATGNRHYHTFEHAGTVYNRLWNIHQEIGLTMPAEMGIAALFHDACYEYGNGSNEDDSAILATDTIHQYDLTNVVNDERVSRLIWLTHFHFTFESNYLIDGDRDAALFLDADIAGLANPWKEFYGDNEKLYREAGVTAETRQTYLTERRDFFTEVFDQEYVFNSWHYRDSPLERQAMWNIEQLLIRINAELKGGPQMALEAPAPEAPAE